MVTKHTSSSLLVVVAKLGFANLQVATGFSLRLFFSAQPKGCGYHCFFGITTIISL